MKTTTEMRLVPIAKLVPYVNNARTHSPEQITKLRSSLREFGFINPVIIDRDFNVIAGHGRILAAKEEDITEVPCVFADHLSEAQKKAYIIADNRMAMDAGWDEELLRVEIESLQGMDFDPLLTGFDEKELADLFADDSGSEARDDDFDLTAALEKASFVERGDVWTIGRHRLVCGDATSAEDVALLMDGRKANLIVTDPPYGVSFKSASGLTIQNDSMKDEEFYNFLLSAFKCMAEHLEKGGAAYVFHADTEGLNFRKAFIDAGFHLAGVCIWVKNSLVLGRSDYQWQHEPILYGFLQNGKHPWYSDRKQTTIWNYDKPKRNANHPTSKPLDLLGYPIGNSTQENAVVIDTFGGSGSTLRGIDMTVQTGEFILLTGRSGCGKTTLIRSLNGLIPHFYPGEIKGDLLMDGKSLLEMKPSELAGQIGTVFQDPRSQFFMTDTTRELAFGCENLGLAREETIERIAKAAKELELVDYLNRSIFALSSGEKQQIAIGSVYALAPKVYIFDEPSANLDYAATRRLAEIMGKLKHAGYTIFVVEHRFYYLRDLIDRVFLIQEGKIEREFAREEFCSLPEKIRISYGLRTAYPERDAEHYQEKPRPHSGTHLMEVRDLGFSYKKGPDVFQNVSFEAHAGDVIGILGHNGAGKTTLLSILTGLLKQQHGEVSFDGKKLTPRQRRSLSYLVMQDTDYQLFASSVEEELSLGIKEECKQKVDATLEALELSEYRERHPASLSGGQKQRVTIGAAIVKDSPVIYFDEPTSGLDYDSMVRVSNLIEQLSNSGVIVFVVSHDFEFIVRTCTEVVQLDDHGAIQNHRLSPEILKTLSEKYFT